jgi:sugar lactone lactonase YvrE
MELQHLHAELVVDCGNILGEGLAWCEEQQTLFWVDIEVCTHISLPIS